MRGCTSVMYIIAPNVNAIPFRDGCLQFYLSMDFISGRVQQYKKANLVVSYKRVVMVAFASSQFQYSVAYSPQTLLIVMLTFPHGTKSSSERVR